MKKYKIFISGVQKELKAQRRAVKTAVRGDVLLLGTMKSDLKDLKDLIRQGERYNLEFKEAFNDSLGKEICAMANANGGKILLGVSDTGEIKGVHITNRLKSQIQDIVRNFDPIFQVSFKDIGNVLVINVLEGSNKPYAVAGKYFLRNGPNSQQLKRDEIRQFFEKEGLIFFDEKVNKTFDMARDFNAASYRRFLKLAGLPKDINKDHILNNLEILEGRHLKNAGVLFFCKTITKHIRQATIICSVFQGMDKYKIHHQRWPKRRCSGIARRSFAGGASKCHRPSQLLYDGQYPGLYFF